MAAADRNTGGSAVYHFLPTGGTPGTDEIVLSSDITSFDEGRSTDTTDMAAGNETTRFPKATIEELSGSASIFDADQVYIPSILPGATGLMTVYKKDIGSGLPYHSYNCLLTGFDRSIPFDDSIEISLTWERQGAMVVEYETAQS